MAGGARIIASEEDREAAQGCLPKAKECPRPGLSDAQPEGDGSALVVSLGALGPPLDAVEAALTRRGAKLVRTSAEADLESALAGSEPALVLIEPTLPGLDPAALVQRLRAMGRERPSPVALLVPFGAPPPAGDALAGLDWIDPLGASPIEPRLALYLELWRTRGRAARLQRQVGRVEAELGGGASARDALAERVGAREGELAGSTEQLVHAGKLVMLGELIVGIAHELNNPLSFAISQLGTARRGLERHLARRAEPAPEGEAELVRLNGRLDGVLGGLERIRSLVARLQSFARLDEGPALEVDVPSAVAAVLTLLEHRIAGRVQVTVAFGEPRFLHCHPGLIDQCVSNLIVNAIDAIDGEGHVHISGGADSDCYVLRVVDSGQGIPRELAARIFEPFFTTKPRGKGTGLGLSIASTIVRRHGGTLRLEPGSEGGTQAILSVPLPSAASQPG